MACEVKFSDGHKFELEKIILEDSILNSIFMLIIII